MKPILYLDIDGVLNNWMLGGTPWKDEHGNATDVFVPGPDIRPRIDAANAEALEHVLRTVGDVDIILSSSWRKVLDIKVMQEWLRSSGAPSAVVVGRTCMQALGECGANHSRGGHIQATHARMPHVNWCALDDDVSIILPGINHVNTDPDIGLTMNDAKRAIAYLTGAA